MSNITINLHNLWCTMYMIYLTEHMNKMSFISMSMPIATTDFTIFCVDQEISIFFYKYCSELIMLLLQLYPTSFSSSHLSTS